ncbi:MAG: serine hydrolase [Steroidobacteraceae bacterium]
MRAGGADLEPEAKMITGAPRYPAYLLAIGLLLGLGIRSTEAAIAANVQQRIDRICNDIPPPVIIAAERPEDTTLRTLMEKLHVPGISVAVIHNGTIEWARGFGVRDAAGDPVTPTTLFQASSISKPITALAVLRLVDSHKVSLNADANVYLKSWKVPDNEFTAKREVTLRELLSHTAGVTVDGFHGYNPGEPLPSLLQILDGEPPADNAPIRVDTVPDTEWRYSGGGYVIIRQLLEDVTGETYSELLQASVLGPSGMRDSTFSQPLPARLRTNAAAPYGPNGRPVSTGALIFPELAPDGLWTTPSDLARYAIQVQRALAGAPGALVSAQTAHLMLTPRRDHYGLGVVAGDDPEHPWFTHNGGNYAFPSLFVAYDKGDGAVIMSNGQGGFEVEIDLLRGIAQEYGWPDFMPSHHRAVSIDIKNLDRYVGAYRISANTFAVVTRSGSRLFLQTSFLGRQPMYPLSARRFVVKRGVIDPFFNRIDEIEVTFAADPRGRVMGLNVEQEGTPSPNVAPRMEGTNAVHAIEDMAAVTRRFQLQEPAPGDEMALRELLEELAMGTTRYRGVTADFAETLRLIVALNRHVFVALGPVQSIAFLYVSPTGMDTYHIVFRNGQGDMNISFSDAGKVRFARYFAG